VTRRTTPYTVQGLDLAMDPDFMAAEVLHAAMAELLIGHEAGAQARDGAPSAPPERAPDEPKEDP